MDNVLKRLGLKKGEPRDSEARQKLQKQLFAYSKVRLIIFIARFENRPDLSAPFVALCSFFIVYICSIFGQIKACNIARSMAVAKSPHQPS